MDTPAAIRQHVSVFCKRWSDIFTSKHSVAVALCEFHINTDGLDWGSENVKLRYQTVAFDTVRRYPHLQDHLPNLHARPTPYHSRGCLMSSTLPKTSGSMVHGPLGSSPSMPQRFRCLLGSAHELRVSGTISDPGFWFFTQRRDARRGGYQHLRVRYPALLPAANSNCVKTFQARAQRCGRCSTSY